ncbi:MAG: c-type cytochrome, partial [Bdellovibrio sp.]|nr:c-type cytochrome [Bdellovibrio sp.]
YLSRQLEDYASGARKNAVMEPIAKALSGQERDNVSAYYASLKMQKWKPAKKPAASILKRGELLAKTGDQKIMVQACNNCHGPGGIGMGPAIPYIAGQFGSYIQAQLNLWKSGQRANSPGQMLEIARRLSDKDIAALAAYFEQVQTSTP